MKPVESLIPRIRPDVTDALDTTTQLETLGYNRYHTNRDFNLKTTFELGKALFRIIPKRSFFSRVQPSPNPLLRQLLIAFGLVLTFIARPDLWPLIALVAWNLISYPLLSQSGNPFTRLFTLVLISGLVLILLCNLVTLIDISSNAFLLFWLNFSLNLWNPPKPYGWLFLLLLGTLGLVSPEVAIIGFLIYSLRFVSVLELPKASTIKFLNDHQWTLVLNTLYAAGIAYLLWYLVSAKQPWPGLLMLATTIFVSQWLERSLIYTLQKLLWSSHNREDYHTRLFSSLMFWGQILLVLGFMAVLLAIKFFNPSLVPMTHFMLLGWSIGLGHFLLNLEQLFLVSTGFVLAALLVIIGFPFWVVMLGLVLIFLTGMMLSIMRVEGYSSSIL